MSQARQAPKVIKFDPKKPHSIIFDSLSMYGVDIKQWSYFYNDNKLEDGIEPTPDLFILAYLKFEDEEGWWINRSNCCSACFPYAFFNGWVKSDNEGYDDEYGKLCQEEGVPKKDLEEFAKECIAPHYNGYYCDECKETICTGSLWNCLTCNLKTDDGDSFDLCADCYKSEAKRDSHKTHEFIKKKIKKYGFLTLKELNENEVFKSSCYEFKNKVYN